MLDCKKATALMSRGLDGKLTLWQKAGLRLHLMACDGCTHFNRQVRFLRTALRRLPEQEQNHSSGENQP
ncbi:MAG: zf-HC2 domain-containing protein [Betaproteobacteria bacterium]|nr:zf-HC2 domain-containing protein [Betaproteobacteria bacterium]MDE2623332.1 zf-HC2 domain-containing protein [Betaproteobacteria bacterium]